MAPKTEPARSGWRAKAYEVVFESDTAAGRAFDLLLILTILSSIAAVMLESVESMRREHGAALRAAEWTFTLLFTAEYLLRLACVARPGRYAKSFFGIVDLLAILPTFVSVLLPGTQALIVIRTLRILRVFRVLKLASYVNESEELMRALWASRRKIQVFVVAVFTLVVIFGAIMYLVEGPRNGFTSIPRSLYWAVVTMTTVGYGDISPRTDLGQAIAAVIMILGYGIIAVPTGIVSAELVRPSWRRALACAGCGANDHQPDAAFCRRCGGELAR